MQIELIFIRELLFTKINPIFSNFREAEWRSTTNDTILKSSIKPFNSHFITQNEVLYLSMSVPRAIELQGFCDEAFGTLAPVPLNFAKNKGYFMTVPIELAKTYSHCTLEKFSLTKGFFNSVYSHVSNEMVTNSVQS